MAFSQRNQARPEGRSHIEHGSVNLSPRVDVFDNLLSKPRVLQELRSRRTLVRLILQDLSDQIQHGRPFVRGGHIDGLLVIEDCLQCGQGETAVIPGNAFRFTVWFEKAGCFRPF